LNKDLIVDGKDVVNRMLRDLWRVIRRRCCGESMRRYTQEEGIQIYKHELDMFEACKKYKYKN
jgi:hypothetical protein